jgi:hypothetical protein
MFGAKSSIQFAYSISTIGRSKTERGTNATPLELGTRVRAPLRRSPPTLTEERAITSQIDSTERVSPRPFARFETSNEQRARLKMRRFISGSDAGFRHRGTDVVLE